jgi:hypothetical protein
MGARSNLVPARLSVALALALASSTPARADRNPSAAFGLALLPGALVHGAGNYYAGERKTGGILFLSEVFGLALMNLSHPSGDPEQRLGDRDRATRSDGGLQTVGRVLFVGSWLYDLASASDAARRRNRRRVREGLELGFEPAAEGRRTSFNPRARYSVRFGRTVPPWRPPGPGPRPGRSARAGTRESSGCAPSTSPRRGSRRASSWQRECGWWRPPWIRARPW